MLKKEKKIYEKLLTREKNNTSIILPIYAYYTGMRDAYNLIIKDIIKIKSKVKL